MVQHWARVKGVLPERLELCCLPEALPLIAHFIVPLLTCCQKKSTVNKHVSFCRSISNEGLLLPLYPL